MRIIRRKTKQFNYILLWIFIFEILFINGAKLFILDGLANNNNSVRLFEVEGSVSSVDMSYDGEYIVVGSTDNYLYLFNYTSSIPIWKYDTGTDIHSVSISSNGQKIAVGCDNGRLYLFDKLNSTPLWYFGVIGAPVLISSDGNYSATGGWNDHNIYFFNNTNSTPLWNYTMKDSLSTVSVSSNGQYIVAGTWSWDKSIYFFEKYSPTPLWSYKTGDIVYSVAMSSNGQYIAAGSRDHNLYFFNNTSSNPLWTYNFGKQVHYVTISSDGNYIAIGSWSDNEVCLFNKSSSIPLRTYTAGSYLPGIRDVSISSDGQYIAVGCYDKKAYLFNITSNKPLWTYTGVHSVEISSNGQYVVAVDDNIIYLIPTTYKLQRDYPLVGIIIIASIGISVLGVLLYLAYYIIDKRVVNP